MTCFNCEVWQFQSAAYERGHKQLQSRLHILERLVSVIVILLSKLAPTLFGVLETPYWHLDRKQIIFCCFTKKTREILPSKLRQPFPPQVVICFGTYDTQYMMLAHVEVLQHRRCGQLAADFAPNSKINNTRAQENCRSMLVPTSIDWEHSVTARLLHWKRQSDLTARGAGCC